jgi:hypothetical protein
MPPSPLPPPVCLISLQKAVHQRTQIRFPELGMPPLILQERQPPNEDHITCLFEMGLAKRARASQVLEAVGGNLQDAIEMLLANSDIKFNPTWVDWLPVGGSRV